MLPCVCAEYSAPASKFGFNCGAIPARLLNTRMPTQVDSEAEVQAPECFLSSVFRVGSHHRAPVCWRIKKRAGRGPPEPGAEQGARAAARGEGANEWPFGKFCPSLIAAAL